MDKYDSSNDIYCYPNTNVLKNKLGITDGNVLEEAEREITSISIDYIKYADPPYHLEYLQAIHATLFYELYDWAGQLRSVDISKGNTRFCTATRIIPESIKLFNLLKKENYLADSGNNFAMKLAEYYAEFNMIHPFREGNGRVQRLFFEHLAAYNGYALDWSLISQTEWIQANIDGFHVEYQSLADIFQKVLTK
jgi:cell filamentation protein